MDEEEALAKAGPEGARLKRAADAEKLDNEQDLNRRRGDPVLYGQIVQLLHRASMRYVRTSSTTTSRLEPRFVVCRCFALMSISNTLCRDLNVSYWSCLVTFALTFMRRPRNTLGSKSCLVTKCMLKVIAFE